MKETISSFQGTSLASDLRRKKSGGDGAVDTPVPIPNTEVKHRSGEGIRLAGENSELPGFFLFRGLFLLFVLSLFGIISDGPLRALRQVKKVCLTTLRFRPLGLDRKTGCLVKT